MPPSHSSAYDFKTVIEALEETEAWRNCRVITQYACSNTFSRITTILKKFGPEFTVTVPSSNSVVLLSDLCKNIKAMMYDVSKKFICYEMYKQIFGKNQCTKNLQYEYKAAYDNLKTLMCVHSPYEGSKGSFAKFDNSLDETAKMLKKLREDNGSSYYRDVIQKGFASQLHKFAPNTALTEEGVAAGHRAGSILGDPEPKKKVKTGLPTTTDSDPPERVNITQPFSDKEISDLKKMGYGGDSRNNNDNFSGENNHYIGRVGMGQSLNIDQHVPLQSDFNNPSIPVAPSQYSDPGSFIKYGGSPDHFGFSSPSFEPNILFTGETGLPSAIHLMEALTTIHNIVPQVSGSNLSGLTNPKAQLRNKFFNDAKEMPGYFPLTPGPETQVLDDIGLQVGNRNLSRSTKPKAQLRNKFFNDVKEMPGYFPLTPGPETQVLDDTNLRPDTTSAAVNRTSDISLQENSASGKQSSANSSLSVEDGADADSSHGSTSQLSEDTSSPRSSVSGNRGSTNSISSIANSADADSSHGSTSQLSEDTSSPRSSVSGRRGSTSAISSIADTDLKTRDPEGPLTRTRVSLHETRPESTNIPSSEQGPSLGSGSVHQPTTVSSNDRTLKVRGSQEAGSVQQDGTGAPAYRNIDVSTLPTNPTNSTEVNVAPDTEAQRAILGNNPSSLAVEVQPNVQGNSDAQVLAAGENRAPVQAPVVNLVRVEGGVPIVQQGVAADAGLAPKPRPVLMQDGDEKRWPHSRFNGMEKASIQDAIKMDVGADVSASLLPFLGEIGFAIGTAVAIGEEFKELVTPTPDDQTAPVEAGSTWNPEGNLAHSAPLPSGDAAGTMIRVSTIDQLNTALAVVAAGTGLYTIQFQNDIRMAPGQQLMAAQLTASQVIVDGQGYVLDGGGQSRGFLIFGGAAMIKNMTIADMLARGGDGGVGAMGGGGGAGLGGGAFVAGNAALVTVDVQYVDTQAVGGNGGGTNGDMCAAGGGGGGLGGFGGNGVDEEEAGTGGGGGGIGQYALGVGLVENSGQGILLGAPLNTADNNVDGMHVGVPGGQGGVQGGGGGWFSGGGIQGGTIAAQDHAGTGGWGGGGGGGEKGGIFTDTSGGDGGFGGGGGGEGNGGGNGGWGGGGGGGSKQFNGQSGSGGFGAGGGGNSYWHADGRGGGGGAGAGGALFIENNATAMLIGGSQTGGLTSGGRGNDGGGDGQGYGNGIFLAGTSKVELSAQLGDPLSIEGTIADETGSMDPGHAGTGVGSVVVMGGGSTDPSASEWSIGGTVTLSGTNTYTGGTYMLGNAALELVHATGAGTGAITFEAGLNESLILDADATANGFADMLTNWSVGGHVDLRGLAFGDGATAVISGDAKTVLVSDGQGQTVTLNIAGLNTSANLVTSADGQGGTLVTMLRAIAAPSVPVVSSNGAQGATVFTGTADPGNTVSLYSDAAGVDGTPQTILLGSATVGSDGAWSITSNMALPSGTQILNATAANASGNFSGPSEDLQVTSDGRGNVISVLSDPLAPVSGVLTVGGDLGSQSRTIAFGTDLTSIVVTPDALTGTALMPQLADIAQGDSIVLKGVAYDDDTTVSAGPSAIRVTSGGQAVDLFLNGLDPTAQMTLSANADGDATLTLTQSSGAVPANGVIDVVKVQAPARSSTVMVLGEAPMQAVSVVRFAADVTSIVVDPAALDQQGELPSRIAGMAIGDTIVLRSIQYDDATVATASPDAIKVSGGGTSVTLGLLGLPPSASLTLGTNTKGQATLTMVAPSAGSGSDASASGPIQVDKVMTTPVDDGVTAFSPDVQQIVVDPTNLANGSSLTGMAQGDSILVNQMFADGMAATSSGSTVTLTGDGHAASLSIAGLSPTATLVVTETDQGAAKLTLATELGTPTILGQLTPDGSVAQAVAGSIVGTGPANSTIEIEDTTSLDAPKQVATTQSDDTGVWAIKLGDYMRPNQCTLVVQAVDGNGHTSVASSPFSVTVNQNGTIHPDVTTCSWQTAIQDAMADLSNTKGSGSINLEKSLPGSTIDNILAGKEVAHFNV